jgi:hypothetical protein
VKRAALILGASLLMASLALVVTPPRAIVRALARTFPTHLLADTTSATGLSQIVPRSLQLYVKTALASYLAERVDASGAPDEVVLVRVIDTVRATVLNQVQVSHDAKLWSALISGFGYCDQINAEVARVAAHYFPKAHIYALHDPVRRNSPHTIGRVWSDAYQDWLYFDAFYDVPVIFRRSGDGEVQFLVKDGTVLPSRSRPLFEIYRLGGWTLNSYGASVAGQVWVKIAQHLGVGDIEAAPPGVFVVPGPPPQVAAAPAPGPRAGTRAGSPSPAPATPAAHVARPAFERLAGAYLQARLDHLLSNSPAQVAYESVSSELGEIPDETAAELAAAAHLFATGQ